MRITRDMLLNSGPECGVNENFMIDCEMLCIYAIESTKNSLPAGAALVWEFHKAPQLLQKLCNWNGGDEDWMVLMEEEPKYLPGWIERLDSDSNPDVYLLNGAVIYVGSHS